VQKVGTDRGIVPLGITRKSRRTVENVKHSLQRNAKPESCVCSQTSGSEKKGGTELKLGKFTELILNNRYCMPRISQKTYEYPLKLPGTRGIKLAKFPVTSKKN